MPVVQKDLGYITSLVLKFVSYTEIHFYKFMEFWNLLSNIYILV